MASDREDWTGLERPEATCGGCGKRLADEAQSYAALAPEGDGWRRRDYCVPCFEALPVRPFSFWKRAAAARAAQATGEKDDRREKRRRDLDALVELFERLADPPKEKAEDAGKLRYLLALALVRKKRLQLVDLARQGGADCLIIRASGEAELVTVPAPQLSKEDLERLARDLETEVGLT